MSTFTDELERLCTFVKPEEEHLFVMESVKNLEKHGLPKCRPEIKKVLKVFLKKYSSSESQKVRNEILPMWQMLAEHSDTMNLSAILERVQEQYTDYLPYYRLYLSELLKDGLLEEATLIYLSYASRHADEAAMLFREFPMLARQIKSHMLQPEDSVFIGAPTKCIEAIVARYRAYGLKLGALLASYFGIHMVKLLEQFTSAGFVHGQLGPSNIVVIERIDNSIELEQLFQKPMLKALKPSQNSPSSAEISDHFGFIRSMGHMIFQDEFGITESNGVRSLNKVVPRRYFDRKLWAELFEHILNSHEFSTWGYIGDQLIHEFRTNLRNNMTFWQNSVLEFNRIYDQIGAEN